MQAKRHGALRRALASSAVDRALGAALRRLPRPPGSLVVPMFHRTPDLRRFEAQLDALLEGGAPVSGSDVLAALRGERGLPRGAVWATFDDAYGEFLEVAADVLERRGVPATMFVSTRFVGSAPADYWWDRLEAAFDSTDRGDAFPLDAPGGALQLDLRTVRGRGRAFRAVRERVKATEHAAAMELVEAALARLGDVAVPGSRVLDWTELRSLGARGFEFGGHTHSHPMLDRIPAHEVHGEVERGFEELERELPTALPIFAYPAGQFDEAVRAGVERTRAAAAVTTRQGLYRVDCGAPFEIPRVPVGPDTAPGIVRARLVAARWMP
ncbi:MAG: polysaccharide deacetylase family protein [Planctomycetota bacterium]